MILVGKYISIKRGKWESREVSCILIPGLISITLQLKQGGVACRRASVVDEYGTANRGWGDTLEAHMDDNYIRYISTGASQVITSQIS